MRIRALAVVVLLVVALGTLGCRSLLGIHDLQASGPDAPAAGSPDGGTDSTDGSTSPDAAWQGSGTRTLRILVEGPGTVSGPSGQSCKDDCLYPVTQGQTVALTTTLGSLTGWFGCDPSPIGSCDVTMTNDRTIMAVFDDGVNAPILVDLEGASGGEVSISTGNSCATGLCLFEVPDVTQITLTADAQTVGAASFVGWGGDCLSSHAGTCTLMSNRSTLQVATAAFVSGKCANRDLGGAAVTTTSLAVSGSTAYVGGVSGPSLWLGEDMGMPPLELGTAGSPVSALAVRFGGNLDVALSTNQPLQCNGTTITGGSTGQDVFLLNVDSTLGCEAGRRWGGSGDDTVRAIVTDPDNLNQAYLTGAASPDASFDGLTVFGDSQPILYVTEVDANNDAIGLFSLTDFDRSEGLAIDRDPSTHKLVVAGTGRTAAGDDDVVVVVLDEDLTMGVSGTTYHFGTSADDRPMGVAVANGRIVVTGVLGDKPAFLGGDFLPSRGGTDAFVVVLDEQTGDIIGADRFGGGEDDDALALAPSSDGYFVVGRAGGGPSWFGGEPVQPAPPPSTTPFVIDWDPVGGRALWSIELSLDGTGELDAAVGGTPGVFAGSFGGGNVYSCSGSTPIPTGPSDPVLFYFN